MIENLGKVEFMRARNEADSFAAALHRFGTCSQRYFILNVLTSLYPIIYNSFTYIKIIAEYGSALSEVIVYDDCLPSTNQTVEPQSEDYADNSPESKLKQYNLLLQIIEMERRLGNIIL